MFFCFYSLPGLPKDFVPKDPKLLLPKDFQPNKEFHPKIGHEDEDEDDDHGDGDEGDDDVDHPNSFPSMPGSLPRTNVGHGKNHNVITVPTYWPSPRPARNLYHSR